MYGVINNARARMAQKRASDDELARLIGMTVEELDADTTAPDPMAPDYTVLAAEEQQTEAAILDAAIAYNEGMMIPDYDQLATDEPTSQVKDCRDSAEVPA